MPEPLLTQPPTQMVRDPAFGHDDWPNEATRPTLPLTEEAVSLALASHVFTGADTIKSDIGLLPNNLNAYMSYVDNFGGYNELVTRFGVHSRALLLSITIFGNPARCADVEPGAMHADQFPGWHDHTALKDGGLDPWGYTSASNMQALINAAGNRPFVRWSAHYGWGPHICGPHTCGFPQAHWTQWDDKGPQGQNFDRSVGSLLPAPPKPKTPAHGKFKAEIQVNCSTGAHRIVGLPSAGVKLGGPDRWASAIWTFDADSNNNSLDSASWNAPPLGP